MSVAGGVPTGLDFTCQRVAGNGTCNALEAVDAWHEHDVVTRDLLADDALAVVMAGIDEEETRMLLYRRWEVMRRQKAQVDLADRMIERGLIVVTAERQHREVERTPLGTAVCYMLRRVELNQRSDSVSLRMREQRHRMPPDPAADALIPGDNRNGLPEMPRKT